MLGHVTDSRLPLTISVHGMQLLTRYPNTDSLVVRGIAFQVQAMLVIQLNLYYIAPAGSDFLPSHGKRTVAQCHLDEGNGTVELSAPHRSSLTT